MTRAALVVDLENVLFPSRCVSGAALRAHLDWIVDYLVTRREVTWSLAAGDRWLVRALLPSANRHGIHLESVAVGPDLADRRLLDRGRDVPASVEEILLVTGDDDLLPLVRHHQAAARRVVVVGPHGSTSRHLIAAADEHWPLAPWALVRDSVLAA